MAKQSIVAAGAGTIDSSSLFWVNSSIDQDRILSYNGYQYAAYWDADLSLALVRIKLSNGSKQIIHFTDVLPASGWFDGHRAISIGISPGDGRMHMSYGNHGDPHNYRHTQANWITSPPAERTHEF